MMCFLFVFGLAGWMSVMLLTEVLLLLMVDMRAYGFFFLDAK